MSRDENQNYSEYTIPSPVSMSPGPYSPDAPASPDRKRESLISTTNKMYCRRESRWLDACSLHSIAYVYDLKKEVGSGYFLNVLNKITIGFNGERSSVGKNRLQDQVLE